MTVETVLTLLKTYFDFAGEEFAKKVGEQLADKCGELYQAIRGKLRTDAYAASTLERAVAEPASADRMAALRGVLGEALKEDPQFAQDVDRLLREARAVDDRGILASGNRNIAIGGDAAGVFSTGDNAHINRD